MKTIIAVSSNDEPDSEVLLCPFTGVPDLHAGDSFKVSFFENELVHVVNRHWDCNNPIIYCRADVSFVKRFLRNGARSINARGHYWENRQYFVFPEQIWQ